MAVVYIVIESPIPRRYKFLYNAHFINLKFWKILYKKEISFLNIFVFFNFDENDYIYINDVFLKYAFCTFNSMLTSIYYYYKLIFFE